MMVSMYITRPVEFSVFPTTLLLLTLFRLALNISSSRLILLNGNTGTSAAGDVIEAFGNFVVGGNYIIGAVIFLVLIAIQYVVINHGAVRISEVTARFTLDALPGKQMSIDSDLNAGSDRRSRSPAAPQEAGRRSGVLRRHGRRLALHAARCGGEHPDHRHQHHRRLSDRRAAARHGSAARARDLHRADHRRRPGDRDPGADDFDLGRPDRHPRQFGRRGSGTEVRKQVFGNPQPLLLASGVLLALAAFPGLPKIPFLLLGGGPGHGRLAACGKKAAAQRRRPAAAKPARRAKENLEALLRVEPLAVEVGLGLVQAGGRRRRIAAAAPHRRHPPAAGHATWAICCRRCGSPTICRCARASTSISLKGAEIARYELPQGCELAIPAGKRGPPLEGQPTREPAFGMPALVDSGRQRRDARAAPATPWWIRVSVLGTHLAD